MSNLAADTETPVFEGEWRHLAVLSYEVSPELLEPRVPRGTVLDLLDGKALVSVVGFMYQGLEEVGLRFYVRRSTAPERRGVVFVKQVIQRRGKTQRLRAGDGTIQVMQMRHVFAFKEDVGGYLEYAWRIGKHWNHLGMRTTGHALQADPETPDAFLVGRSWIYRAQADGTCVEQHVSQPAWPLWHAKNTSLVCDTEMVFGPEFVAPLANPPVYAYVAAGSQVTVRTAERF